MARRRLQIRNRHIDDVPSFPEEDIEPLTFRSPSSMRSRPNPIIRPAPARSPAASSVCGEQEEIWSSPEPTHEFSNPSPDQQQQGSELLMSNSAVPGICKSTTTRQTREGLGGSRQVRFNVSAAGSDRTANAPCPPRLKAEDERFAEVMTSTHQVCHTLRLHSHASLHHEVVMIKAEPVEQNFQTPDRAGPAEGDERPTASSCLPTIVVTAAAEPNDSRAEAESIVDEAIICRRGDVAVRELLMYTLKTLAKCGQALHFPVTQLLPMLRSLAHHLLLQSQPLWDAQAQLRKWAKESIKWLRHLLKDVVKFTEIIKRLPIEVDQRAWESARELSLIRLSSITNFAAKVLHSMQTAETKPSGQPQSLEVGGNERTSLLAPTFT